MNKRKLEETAQGLIDQFCAFDGDRVKIIRLAAQVGFCVGEADVAENTDGIIAVDRRVEALPGFGANMVIATRRGMEAGHRRLAIARLLARYLLRPDQAAPIFAARDCG